MITGIIVALPEELKTLTSASVQPGQQVKLNETTLLVLAGAGPENAAHAAQQLISHGANRLISWGCAAALEAWLKPGDLVLANRLIATDGENIEIAAVWHEYVAKTLADRALFQEAVAESHTIVANAHAKQRLQQQTNAVAVDMESTAIARIARQHNIPCLVLRVIADTAGMDLPYAVTHAMKADGTVDIASLLRYLITHPGEIPGLIKLGLAFSAAQKTLTTLATQLDKMADFPAESINA